ncbi:MAG: CHAT domain-containing protein, partial [Anaerolineales bacterium]|nr:CHAT domain-containing protein [Anaerolineales bacterium]
KQRQLETVLKPSSYIHFASKEAANMIMPLAMLYDRRKFNSDLRQDVYKLCPEFIQTVNEQRPLATSKCFQGACPSEAAADTVCPSGFWGFRHRLGMPVSTPTVTDIPTTLTYMNDPQLVMSVALNLGEVNQHMRSMIRLWPSKSLKIVKSPEDTILSFLNEKPHLVYFYCHGGETQGHAYLQVGTADSSQNISSETLFREDVYWEEPRPLVIINGCHTTALEPRAALDLVSGFMEVGNASGVIGTEITIFETLAQGFAEPLLSALLNGEPVGEAVRLARLALLQQKNPLGLVYVPFALAGVRMQRAEIVIN